MLELLIVPRLVKSSFCYCNIFFSGFCCTFLVEIPLQGNNDSFRVLLTFANFFMNIIDFRNDPFAGPLSELEKWKRRQKLMTSVTDQLKSKDCKGVIAVLITAKSKVLKRWKAIDARYNNNNSNNGNSKLY